MINQSPCNPSKRHYEPQAILAYISWYQEQNEGRSPSQRGIQRDLQISASSVVHVILHRLVLQGLLTVKVYKRGHPAHLLLTEAGQIAVQRWQEGQDDNTVAK